MTKDPSAPKATVCDPATAHMPFPAAQGAHPPGRRALRREGTGLGHAPQRIVAEVAALPAGGALVREHAVRAAGDRPGAGEVAEQVLSCARVQPLGPPAGAA